MRIAAGIGNDLIAERAGGEQGKSAVLLVPVGLSLVMEEEEEDEEDCGEDASSSGKRMRADGGGGYRYGSGELILGFDLIELELCLLMIVVEGFLLMFVSFNFINLVTVASAY